MFGIEEGRQWDALAEKYGLLRRLWREASVTWSGEFRGPLEEVTSLPRPYAGAPRTWHGSATTLTSAALAAEWGDPLFSANAIQPRDAYTRLIEHYRSEHARHGHDPRFAYVGAGAGFLYVADTTQEARRAFGPTYERMIEFFNAPGNHTPGNDWVFTSIDDAIERGPVLVGSPQQIAEKILWFHEAYGHDLQSFSLPTVLPHEQRAGDARAGRRRGAAGRAEGRADDAVDRGGPVRRTARLRGAHGRRRGGRDREDPRLSERRQALSTGRRPGPPRRRPSRCGPASPWAP
ncbi:LLM class flavin-dependent oxidoreductase [Nocardioides convexus]|uniref:LLM class flavin-dependent oxidoreductase n=1 Tax=Nocardioides convexus TaxID=2712224 RepID=UPI0024187A41|nr:LLM class flavin-dependent oxidoreductase [Nocardioides convexus]